MKRRPYGTALISVLLVVFMATALAASMMTAQRLAVMRMFNQQERAQAMQYALGGEELARQILHQDMLETEIDHSAELWATVLPPYEFADGEVELQIRDAQGLFNLNSLVLPGPRGALARTRFTRLLGQLGLDPVIADRLADFIDPDQQNRPLGAEDFEYLAQEPPYRTSGVPFAHPSELMLLLEFEPQAWPRLQPFVVALPDPQLPVNINTAPAEILSVLVPAMTPEQAQGLVEYRNQVEGFRTVNDFFQQPGVAGEGLSADGLAVVSSHYEVAIEARYNGAAARLFSTIQRDRTAGQLRVIARDLGQRFVSLAIDPEAAP